MEDYVFDCKDIFGRFDHMLDCLEITYPVFGTASDEDVERRYEEPYDVIIRQLRYAANESKREHANRIRTAARRINNKTGRDCSVLSAPQLMSSEARGLENPERGIDGI